MQKKKKKKKKKRDDCAAVKLVEEKRLRAGQAELTGCTIQDKILVTQAQNFMSIWLKIFYAKKVYYRTTPNLNTSNTKTFVEISSSILRIVDGQNTVSWGKFILDMKDFIISKYDGKSLMTFKGDWKRRFKASLKLLEFEFGGSIEDVINSVSKKSACTTSFGSSFIYLGSK
jgi:hypothetical protein